MHSKELEKLIKKAKDATAISSEKKQELLTLLDELKKEITSIENDIAKHQIAEIVTKAHDATDKAISKLTIPNVDAQKELMLLKDVITEFESSHPKLVQTVNRFCIMLSNIGI